MNVRPRRISLRHAAAIAPWFCLISSQAAFAGDPFPPAPTFVEQGRCKSFGEGFYSVKGSDACVRISGYIAAGVQIAAPRRIEGAFAPPAVSTAGARAEARFNAELGPGRLYVEVGHNP